jgi:DNA replication and repair protein RecF
LISQLLVNDFRNLEPLDWWPGRGSHLLLGGNGAGKTSLLEAVYVLATTRSFRAAQIVDCARHGSASFRLHAEVDTDRRSSLEVLWNEGRRERTLNGKVGPLAEHLAALPVVAWTSAEAEVLIGAPKARRRFLDRGIVASRPAALELLGRYREALRQKRELLLQGGGAGIEIWNELLASLAAEVIRLRHEYVESLRGMLLAVVEESGLPFPPVELRYRPSPTSGLDGAESIAESLDAIAEKERRRQLPLLGPHRDELEILWGGHDIRRVASAGERKALSLLLLAAHGRAVEAAGRSPVYLLDDADAELAPTTHSAVWKVFQGAESRQILASSNRPQVWLTLEVGKVWEMEKGKLSLLS